MQTSIIVTIHYCAQCKWLLRAAWIAQELLQTFKTNITSVNLKPGTHGVYQIFINDIIVWDKKLNQGFPEASTIKIQLRDLYLPHYNLKHQKNNDYI